MITRTVLTPQQYAELSEFVKHNDLIMDLVAGGATLTVEQQIEHTNKMADFVKSLWAHCPAETSNLVILEWRLCNNSVLLVTWKERAEAPPKPFGARPDPSRVRYITPDRVDIVMRPGETLESLMDDDEIRSLIPESWSICTARVEKGPGGPMLILHRKGE